MDKMKIDKMNTRKKGYYRDKLIVEAIEEYEILTTEQVYLLFFSSIKYGIIKCRERLRKLVSRKKISSIRLDINECNKFYVDKLPKFLEHDINRNWGFLYLLKMVEREHKYYKYSDMKKEYIMDCGRRPDGIIGFKNYISNEYMYFIIESDRVESKNEFMKIINYNDIFKNRDYENEYWFNRVNRFPHILIVCNSDKKKDEVLKKVEKDNIEYKYYDKNGILEKKENLKFIVFTVDEIKEYLLN